MVDDVEVAARSHAIQGTPSPSAHASVAPAAEHIPLTVRDAVELSSDARKIIKQLQESQTVAEAFLAKLTDPKRLIEEPATSNKSDMTGKDEEQAKKAMKNAMSWAVEDIGWLFDALTLDKTKMGKVGDAIFAAANRDGVGVRPPLPEVVARAHQTGSVAALFIEDAAVTVQRGEVVDASVKKVSLTTVHHSMRDRISDKSQPLVLDVGGALQEVAAANGGTGEVVFTPIARPAEPGATREPDPRRAEDIRHALLIVREGASVHAGSAVRLRLDAVIPLS